MSRKPGTWYLGGNILLINILIRFTKANIQRIVWKKSQLPSRWNDKGTATLWFPTWGLSSRYGKCHSRRVIYAFLKKTDSLEHIYQLSEEFSLWRRINKIDFTLKYFKPHMCKVIKYNCTIIIINHVYISQFHF